MALIDDIGLRIQPKPIEPPKPKVEAAPPVQNESDTKKFENNFAGSLFKSKLDFSFRTDTTVNNPKDITLLALFDDKSIIKVDNRVEQPNYNYDKNMSAQDVAKNLLSQGNTANSYQDQPQYYFQALKDHKNDPQWMADFYKSLGPDETAKLIDNSVTTGPHQYSNPEEVRANVAAIRESITNMANANPPLFEQKDMDALVKSFSKDAKGEGIYDLVAVEIFGKMDFKSENLKTMFFKSASQLALSGDLGDKQSQGLAAAAAHVLSQTSAANQAEQLSALRGQAPSGAVSDLTKFVNLAMKGPKETPSLESRLGTLPQYPGPHGSATPETYGKVDSLIFNAAYSGYHDPFAPGPNLSTDQIKALRTELFTAATGSLTDPSVESAYKNSVLFKDGLSEIFMQDFSMIYKSGLGENGSGLSSASTKGLSAFFKLTVFTTSPGNLQKPLMNFIREQVQSITQGLNSTDPNAEKAFQDKFGGLTRLDGAALLGNLLGAMKKGLDAHISDITKDAEAKKQALGFLFDITIGLIPGIGGKLTKEAENTAYKLLGQIADKAQSKIMDSIKSGALDNAKEYFLQANSDKNPVDLLNNLKEGVNMSLPDGDNGTAYYHQTFQSAYDYTLNNN